MQIGEVSLERMVQAVENVRRRLLRATRALEDAQVPYAVVGGNAVASWVSRVDTAAVRNTQDVDLLLRRADLDKAKAALAPARFIYRHSARMDMFLDGPSAKARDALHVVFAGEKVRPDYLVPVPDVSESEMSGDIRILHLEALVRMKLTSYWDKDRVHLRDLLDVALIDENWVKRFPPELGVRLQTLIDTPDG